MRRYDDSHQLRRSQLPDARRESWDQIRKRLLHGPITGTIQVNNSEAGQKYLYWSGPCEPGATCIETVYHRVVLVGYKQQIDPTGSPTNRKLLVKNSWGLNDYGFSDYVWISWENGGFYKESDWLQISAMTASYATADTDGDGLPNHRDICPHVPSGRQGSRGIVQPNLDNDSLGDECDPDMDGDLVLDVHDCHPTHRYMGFDLDADGLCDDLDRVDLLAKRAKVVASDPPDKTGAHPYVYVDGQGQRLALAPMSGDKPFAISSLDLDEPSAEWQRRPLLNDEPAPGQEDDGCSCATQREAHGWPGLLLLLALILGIRAQRRRGKR